MPNDIVKPVGVVFMVNGVPYVTMFNDTHEMDVAHGQRITITLDGITTEPWAGVDNMAGMLPLKDLEAPTPPKFASHEEAEAWLDQYPAIT
jgi:hypothetical protein